MKYLITHPGSKHLDDTLTIALVLSQFPSLPVFFRNPTEEELNDPEIIVADVGRRYEPKLMNFDHHQLNRSTCAAALYMEHLGLLHKAHEIWPWFEHLEICDSRGPVAASNRFGFNSDLYQLLSSPVESTLLYMLKDRTSLQSGDPMHTFLGELGRTLLESLRAKSDRMYLLENHTRIVMQPLPILIIDPDIIKTSPEMCVDHWIKTKLGMEPAISISFDERNGSGLALFRFDRVAKHLIDFNLIKNEPGVRFVHITGFLAYIDGDIDTALGLIHKAVVQNPKVLVPGNN